MVSFTSSELKEPAGPVSFWNRLRLRRQPQAGREVLQGALDMPNEFKASDYLEISGWAYSTEAPISQVGGFLDNVPLGFLKCEEPRLDVTSESPSQRSEERRVGKECRSR